MARNLITRRNSDYMRKYGITYDEALAILKAQDNRCAICFRLLDVERIRVDHCHVSGRVRGVLCNSCNCGLGMMGDSVEIMQRAINYLNRAGA